MSVYGSINTAANAGQADQQGTNLPDEPFDKNKGIYPMGFFAPIFGFSLGLFEYPIDTVRAELVKLFDLLDGDDRAVGFVLLNRQVAVPTFNGCVR